MAVERQDLWQRLGCSAENVRVVRPEPSIWTRIYILEIVRGLGQPLLAVPTALRRIRELPERVDALLVEAPEPLLERRARQPESRDHGRDDDCRAAESREALYVHRPSASSSARIDHV